MANTNTDATLLKMAKSYSDSKDARVRNMLRGKAWKLVRKVYVVEVNREAVWSEWCKLADAGKGSWLVK